MNCIDCDAPRRRTTVGRCRPCLNAAISAAQRVTFFNRVTAHGDCWEWGGRRNNLGYGQLIVARRTVLAHRFAYELIHGPIPTGLHVLHHCDNPPCVRPGHLWLGTQSDNLADMWAKGRHPVPVARSVA